MPSFLRATLESAAAAQTATRRRAAQELRRPVAAIDELLTRLEELHLAGRARVPLGLEPSLAALDATLPRELRRRWRPRITIVRLMDALFEVQADLLAPSRIAVDADDEADAA